MPKIAILAVIAIAIMCNSAYAEETCTSTWRYKVVHTEETVDRLVVKTDRLVTAAAALQKVLNRLGRNGWEIASSSKLIVGDGYDLETDAEAGIARFDPPTVLFKKQTTTCTSS